MCKVKSKSMVMWKLPFGRLVKETIRTQIEPYARLLFGNVVIAGSTPAISTILAFPTGG